MRATIPLWARSQILRSGCLQACFLGSFLACRPADPLPQTPPVQLTDSLGTTVPPTLTNPWPDPEERVLRFVVLGDAGEGNEAQYEVGQAIAAVCAVRGCDFALYLGDNFYDTGVSGVDDAQFDTKFEQPYADVDIPFYAVLGNHDLGLQGVGLEFWKADIYVEYTAYSGKWTMPAPYYHFTWGPIGFWALDTTRVFFGLGGDQEDWLAQTLGTSDLEWKIVFGHHPYRSNGSHGNAGNYEGFSKDLPLMEIPRGDFVEDLFTEQLCGNADVYLAGHDHTQQWLAPACGGTELLIAGAGSKLTPLEGRGNATFFEDDTVEGFLYAEIEGNTFSGTFFDRTANELFSMSVSKF